MSVNNPQSWEVASFDPTAYPELFHLTSAGRIVYLKTEKGGKAKSQIWTDPEEKTRASFYCDLVTKLNYPPENIDIEVEVYRRLPKDFADIVVFSDAAHTKPFIVVEAKQEGVTAAVFDAAITQAWGNANNLRAKYAVAVSGHLQFAFEAKGFERKNRAKYAVNLPERYGAPVKFRLKKGDVKWDLQPQTLDELRVLFQQCHDVLWEGGRRNPAEAFDEMSKLMFCKIQDERHLTSDGDYYKFQIGTNQTATEVAKAIKGIYTNSRALMPNVFRSDLLISDDLIYRVVEVLQDASLYKSDLDAKGRAFEKFLGTVFRGKMGQYFTPRPIVEFIVGLLEPNITDRVVDPACGSGGFLLHSLERLQQESRRKFKDVSMQRDYWKDWALRSLHGIEVNDQISRVAMIGMILHEDGHTNIVCSDSLVDFGELLKLSANCRVGSFTKLMTNPPFGAMVKRVTPKSDHPYLDSYNFGKGRNSQKTEVLFLERCIDLLAPGGQMGIVLPEGILNNDRASEIRQFVEDRCLIDAIVSLPQDTFVATGASVKTSVLVFQKFSEIEAARYGQEKAAANAEVVQKYAGQKQALETDYELRIASYGRNDLIEEAKKLIEAKKRSVACTKKIEQKTLATAVREMQKAMSARATLADIRYQELSQKEFEQRLNQLEEVIQMEARGLLKSRVNYPVFVAHAEFVGITATGQPDKNELPDVLKEYKQFRAASPLSFLPTQ